MRSTPRRPAFFHRRFLINPRFQLTLVAYAACLSLIVLALSTLFLLITIGRFPALQSPRGIGFFAVLLFLVFASSVVFCLYFTNKVVGPIYRLKKHMDAATNEETTSDLRFRKGDFFGDLPESYNRLLSKLRQKNGTNGSEAQ